MYKGRLIGSGGPQAVLRGGQKANPRRRYVLMDRDGTLTVESHYLSDPAGVQLLPGVMEGLRRLQDLGLGLVVVTNQSGIGRGFFDWDRLDSIHGVLKNLLAQGNVNLEGIYVCPHCPEEMCRCRKPEPGLVWQAATELGFDPNEAFVIGDKACDVDLGRQIGAVTILVATGYGRATLVDPEVHPDFFVNSLLEAAEVVAKVLDMPPLWAGKKEVT